MAIIKKTKDKCEALSSVSSTGKQEGEERIKRRRVERKAAEGREGGRRKKKGKEKKERRKRKKKERRNNLVNTWGQREPLSTVGENVN
jgi:hypothetical protein